MLDVLSAMWADDWTTGRHEARAALAKVTASAPDAQGVSAYLNPDTWGQTPEALAAQDAMLDPEGEAT